MPKRPWYSKSIFLEGFCCENSVTENNITVSIKLAECWRNNDRYGSGDRHYQPHYQMINIQLVKQLCYKSFLMDLRDETVDNPSWADRFLGSGESRVIFRFGKIFQMTEDKSHPAGGSPHYGSWSGRSCWSIPECSWSSPWCIGKTWKLNPIEFGKLICSLGRYLLSEDHQIILEKLIKWCRNQSTGLQLELVFFSLSTTKGSLLTENSYLISSEPLVSQQHGLAKQSVFT